MGSRERTHYALPLIRDGGGGDIVNVSSVAGRVASLGSGVYNKDIANAVVYALAQPKHVSINEVLVRPTGQARKLADART